MISVGLFIAGAPVEKSVPSHQFGAPEEVDILFTRYGWRQTKKPGTKYHANEN
jgi:hypothetical protein